MKKSLCILLCVAFVFGMAGCGKSLTEWDKKNIETARAEVQEILNADPASFPEATYTFDNETAVADAEKVDVQKVWDYFPDRKNSSRYGKEVNDETLQEAGLLVRYHRGRYYTVNYTTEGNLLFVLFSEDETGMMSAEIHIVMTPGSGLGSAEKFYDVARPGVSRQKVDRSFPAMEIYPTNPLSLAVYLLDDMTTVYIGYHYEGDPDTATKKDVTIPSSDEISFSILGKSSILPYLLPQDLALIS